MIKFWKWLFNFSRKKFMEEHLKIHHNDIKCINCHEWYSISGIDHKHEVVNDTDWGCSVRCGKCKKVSHYNLAIAPVAIRCNEKGIPV